MVCAYAIGQYPSKPYFADKLANRNSLVNSQNKTPPGRGFLCLSEYNYLFIATSASPGEGFLLRLLGYYLGAHNDKFLHIHAISNSVNIQKCPACGGAFFTHDLTRCVRSCRGFCPPALPPLPFLPPSCPAGLFRGEIHGKSSWPWDPLPTRRQR